MFICESNYRRNDNAQLGVQCEKLFSKQLGSQAAEEISLPSQMISLWSNIAVKCLPCLTEKRKEGGERREPVKGSRTVLLPKILYTKDYMVFASCKSFAGGKSFSRSLLLSPYRNDILTFRKVFNILILVERAYIEKRSERK